MGLFVLAVALLVAGFVVGLLVGRRNPALADTAAKAGEAAKVAAQDLAKK